MFGNVGASVILFVVIVILLTAVITLSRKKKSKSTVNATYTANASLGGEDIIVIIYLSHHNVFVFVLSFRV